jgi:hypothetical protein
LLGAGDNERITAKDELISVEENYILIWWGGCSISKKESNATHSVSS